MATNRINAKKKTKKKMKPIRVLPNHMVNKLIKEKRPINKGLSSASDELTSIIAAIFAGIHYIKTLYHKDKSSS